MELLIPIYLVLIFIFYQDLKYRAVYWWLFPLLVLLFGFKQFGKEWDSIKLQIAINLVFLTVQLFFVTLYLSLKKGRLVNITGEYLGLGDILLLIVLTIYLSFLNYIFFYLISLLLIAAFEVIKSIFMTAKNNKIPLAGYQCLLLAFCLMVDNKLKFIDLTQDSWIVSYLNLN